MMGGAFGGGLFFELKRIIINRWGYGPEGHPIPSGSDQALGSLLRFIFL